MDDLNTTAAIQELAKAYANGFLTNDVDAILSLFTDDFVVLTCDKPPITQYQRLHDTLSQELQSMHITKVSYEPQDICIHHNTAYVWGLSNASVSSHPDDPPQQLQGKFLWVVERNHAGDWLIKRDSSIADL